MPNSCKCILDHLLYKSAITVDQYDKILRNLKGVEWIPVTERLPEEEKEYLVTIQSIDRKGEPSRVVTTNWWIPEANNWAFLRLGWETITAWAEKPEPYEEGAEE